MKLAFIPLIETKSSSGYRQSVPSVDEATGNLSARQLAVLGIVTLC